MKALLQVTTIESDTRWAKEIRLLGIPIWHEMELNVRSQKENKSRPIGFETIGSPAPVPLDENEEEEIDTTLYGKEKN